MILAAGSSPARRRHHRPARTTSTGGFLMLERFYLLRYSSSRSSTLHQGQTMSTIETLVNLQKHLQLRDNFCLDLHCGTQSTPVQIGDWWVGVTRDKYPDILVFAELLQNCYNRVLQARCNNPRDLEVGVDGSLGHRRCSADHSYELENYSMHCLDDFVRNVATRLWLLTGEQPQTKLLYPIQPRQLPQFNFTFRYRPDRYEHHQDLGPCWEAKLSLGIKPEAGLWNAFNLWLEASEQLVARADTPADTYSLLMQKFDLVCGQWHELQSAIVAIKKSRKRSQASNFTLHFMNSTQSNQGFWLSWREVNRGKSLVRQSIGRLPRDAALAALLGQFVCDKEPDRRWCGKPRGHKGICSNAGAVLNIH